MTVPALPPGFELDEDTPPLPPGFVVDGDAPKKKARTGAQQFKHDLSYGARSVLEGAGGTVDFFAEPLYRGAEAIGFPQHRFRDLGRMGADAIGLDHPESAGERISSDVTGALSGLSPMGLARQIPASAGPVLQGVKKFFGSQPMMQAAGTITGATAAGATREGGGSDGEQMAAGILGALLPGGGAYATTGAARRAMRGAGGDVYSPGELAVMGHQKGDVAENVLEQLVAFNRAGVRNPSAGQVGQTRASQGAESLLSQFPGSAGVFANHAQGQIDDVTRTVDGMTQGAGPTTAGAAIKQGQHDFMGRLRDVDARVYAPVDAAMGEQPVRIDNTLSTLRRATNPAPGTPAVSAGLGNKKLGSILDNLLSDSRPSNPLAGSGIAPERRIPFSGLKAQRSAIGELIGEASTRDVGAGPKQLSNAYGAMSEDMLAGAREVGPEAEAALVRANRVHGQGMGRDGVLRDTIRDGVPEDVFNRAVAGMNYGGTELSVLMKTLKPAQRTEVARAAIRKLGWTAKGGQDSVGETFDAVTFKNNWAALSKEARSALFDHLPATERKRLQALADVGENVQKGSKVFANPAGTAGKGLIYTGGATAAGLLASGNVLPAAGILASPLLANAAARVLTNPATPQWMLQRTRKPAGLLAPIAPVEDQRKRATRP